MTTAQKITKSSLQKITKSSLQKITKSSLQKITKSSLQKITKSSLQNFLSLALNMLPLFYNNIFQNASNNDIPVPGMQWLGRNIWIFFM